MSKVIKQLRNEPASDKTGSRVFLHLADLIQHYGRTAPARKAILAPGYTPLTYGTLWSRANEMVRGLRSLGVRRSDRVAVVLPAGPETVVATIAVAAGAVCVPLNPAFTADELQRYFADLRIAALLTRGDIGSASRGVAHALGIPVIDLSLGMDKGPGGLGLASPATQRAIDLDPTRRDDDAFILVTSGTTSRPKMVPLTHVSVCLSAHNVGVALALGPRDRLLSVLPLFHGHGLISGVLASLAAGSSVICTSGFDAAAFFSWLTELRPSWYTAVPTIHRAVLSAAGSHNVRTQRSSLRLIRSASSSLPLAVLNGLEDLFGVPVIDTYGMTEAATQIAANPLGRRKPGSVGQPAGPDVAIMDVNGRRVPKGKRGEIVLRGPTITRGYDNNPVVTASAFRDGWFRTGDIGYLDREGYLFIVGRIKDVINRGGQKVAPAEVEETLLRHPDVVDAVAFPIPHRRLGADVAAAVVLRPDAKVSEDKLRAFTRERLAGFKVPSLIRIVLEIPRGPGGKIKRSGIADALSVTPPIALVERGRKAAPPRSELERQLAETWGELLEVDQIDVKQDVFALGADSLTVTQMLSRLQTNFGIKLSFKDILDAPTVTALARQVDQTRKTQPNHTSLDINRVEAVGPPVVSIVQEHWLRIEREVPGLPLFTLPFAYQLQGALDIPALERSLTEVVRRHNSLRTRFAWVDERPVALVAQPFEIGSFLVVEDLAAGKKNNRAKALLLKKAKLRAEQEAWTPFDLTHAPLLRTRLLRLGANDHILLLILHHIIVDGWSIGIFLDEVSELYSAFAGGRQPQLSEPEFQFSDFARWQRWWCTTDGATREFAYWKECLRDASAIFPANGDRGSAELSWRVAHEPVDLPIGLVAQLSALSRRQGGTLFMTLLAGFKALLMARSGRNDICVATPIANRSRLGTEHVIGLVSNTTLIRTRINADMSFEEALRGVRNSVLNAYARQGLPFYILAARLEEEDAVNAALLTQAFFDLRIAARRPLKLPDVAVGSFGDIHREGQPRFPIDQTWLTVTLKEGSSGITGSWSFKQDLFEANNPKHWIADYKTILTKAAANPETPVGQLVKR